MRRVSVYFSHLTGKRTEDIQFFNSSASFFVDQRNPNPKTLHTKMRFSVPRLDLSILLQFFLLPIDLLWLEKVTASQLFSCG